MTEALVLSENRDVLNISVIYIRALLNLEFANEHRATD